MDYKEDTAYKAEHYKERLFAGHGKYQGALYSLLDKRGIVLKYRKDSMLGGWSFGAWYYRGVLVTAQNKATMRQERPRHLCISLTAYLPATRTDLDAIIKDIRKVVPDLDKPK